jgi:hypothetical protein
LLDTTVSEGNRLPSSYAASRGYKFSDALFGLWPILWPPLYQNDTFSDTQEQQKAFLEAQDACKISAWVVGFHLTIPRLSDQSTGA